MSDSIINEMSGSSLFIQIDWADLVNVPSEVENLETTLTNLLTQQNSKVSVSVFNKHHHDCRYFTKNQLKYPNQGGEVNWFNITSLTPAMSAVYYSSLDQNHLLALTTPVNSTSTIASSGNAFVTEYDLNQAITEAATSGSAQISVFDAVTVSSLDTFSPRQSTNIYDLYYTSQGKEITRDWSPIKYHLEYFVHRRNPFYDPPILGDVSEITWIDEDIDGNKVWIGERQIFTGGRDGVTYQSGPFASGRATTIDSDVAGLPNMSDLYNNVANLPNSQREKEFANRQIVIYGGVEIGRNLTLLPPISGSQTLSASGASAYFDDMTLFGDLRIDGDIINPNGSLNIDAVNGSISTSGNIDIAGHINLRNYLQISNAAGTSNIFKVNLTDIAGVQNTLKINKFNFTNGNLAISGSFDALAGGNIHADGYLDVGGAADIGGNVVAGGKLTVGGAGQVSTFDSGIQSDGAGYFFGDITGSVNLYNYKGFFGGDVLISGGLTIQDYFEVENDLSIHGDLTVGNNSTLSNNVTVATVPNSKLIIGSTDNTKQAGDTYIVNWTNSYNKVSALKVFTRELSTSANLLTMRAAQEDIFGSGVTVGPSGAAVNNKSYTNWNGVDIRAAEPSTPNIVYDDRSAWSGLEIKSYLSVLDNTKYKDSQYLVWTSNPKALAKATITGITPTEVFPNTSDNFGWVFSDWFRTAAEETSNIHFPLHLFASKNYVDYRMQQLAVAESAFKVHPENLGTGSGTPEVNDIITWDGDKWIVSKLDINSQLWDIKYIGVSGDTVIQPVQKNTMFVITDEGLDAPFTIHIPAQGNTDAGREIVFKFYDVPAEFFPITLSANLADNIDGNPTYTATVYQSAIKLFIPQIHTWIVV
jgi:cytoskeletal protein CcmA (bactofilin family)